MSGSDDTKLRLRIFALFMMLLLVVFSAGAIASTMVSFFTIRGWWRKWALSREHRAAPTRRAQEPAEDWSAQFPVDLARPETFTELGPIQEMFGPSRKNLVAGIVLGLVLIVGGLAVGRWM